MADPKPGFTTIGPTLVIRGTLQTREKLVIRGRVDAAIISSELVQIEKDGIVKADITATALLVNGIVIGNITAEKHLELGPDGRVIGDISSPVLVIQDGAALRGKISMPGVDEAMEAPYQEPEPMPLRPVVRTTPLGGGEPLPIPSPMPLPDYPPAPSGIYPTVAASMYPSAPTPVYPAIEEIEVGEGAAELVSVEDEPDEETRPVDQPRITMRPGRFRAGASSRLARTSTPSGTPGAAEPGTATVPGAPPPAAPSNVPTGTVEAAAAPSAAPTTVDLAPSSGVPQAPASASPSGGVAYPGPMSGAAGQPAPVDDAEVQKKPRKRFW